MQYTSSFQCCQNWACRWGRRHTHSSVAAAGVLRSMAGGQPVRKSGCAPLQTSENLNLKPKCSARVLAQRAAQRVQSGLSGRCYGRSHSWAWQHRVARVVGSCLPCRLGGPGSPGALGSGRLAAPGVGPAGQHVQHGRVAQRRDRVHGGAARRQGPQRPGHDHACRAVCLRCVRRPALSRQEPAQTQPVHWAGCSTLYYRASAVVPLLGCSSCRPSVLHSSRLPACVLVCVLLHGCRLLHRSWSARAACAEHQGPHGAGWRRRPWPAGARSAVQRRPCWPVQPAAQRVPARQPSS